MFETLALTLLRRYLMRNKQRKTQRQLYSWSVRSAQINMHHFITLFFLSDLMISYLFLPKRTLHNFIQLFSQKYSTIPNPRRMATIRKIAAMNLIEDTTLNRSPGKMNYTLRHWVHEDDSGNCTYTRLELFSWSKWLMVELMFPVESVIRSPFRSF